MRTRIWMTLGFVGIALLPATRAISREQANPSWKLRYVSTCPYSNPEDCAGAYGFMVASNGSYQIGPGPTGERLEGKLELRDFATLEGALNQILAAIQGPQEEICDRHDLREPSAMITLSRQGTDLVLLRQTSKDFCVNRGEPEDADVLHRIMRRLTQKHYALPFP